MEVAVLGEQTIACKMLYAEGRGVDLATLRCKGQLSGLITPVVVQVRGEKTNNFNTWICKEMFMHVFGVTQKNLIIAAIVIAFLNFFLFYHGTEDVTS